MWLLIFPWVAEQLVGLFPSSLRTRLSQVSRRRRRRLCVPDGEEAGRKVCIEDRHVESKSTSFGNVVVAR